MIAGALRSALTAKLRDGELKVVNAFGLADYKTRTMASTLTTLEAKRSVLLVNTVEANRNLELGSRNLPGVKLVATKDVTTYDLLAHKYVVISEAAAKKLSEALAQ
jgi:large subunit ribosomal protein L4